MISAFFIVLFNTDMFIINNNVTLYLDDSKKDISNNISIGGSIEVNREAA